MLQERKAPLITQHETMAGIEHGPAALRRKIERILRQIVFSRYGLRCRAGNVEGRNVIDGMRPGVGRQERESVTEALAQAGFQGVVAGVRDAGDFTDRAVDAIIRLRQSASGIETPLVHVVFGGKRIAACVDAGNKHGRIPFNESRQPHTGGADVPNLK